MRENIQNRRFAQLGVRYFCVETLEWAAQGFDERELWFDAERDGLGA